MAEPSRFDRLKRLLPVRVGLRYAEVDAGNWSAAIALNVLIALFPMVLTILLLVSLFLRSPDSYDAVLAQFARVLPGGVNGDAYAELYRTLNAVRSGTGLLAVLSVGGLMWTGAGLFGCIEAALGKVHGYQPRDFVRGKLVHFGMILIMFVLTLVGIGSSAALALLGPVAESHGAGNIFTGTSGFLLNIVLGTLTGLLLFGMIYGVLPRGRNGLRPILPGTVLAGVGFELLTLLFPLYIRLTEGGNRYGATFGLLLVLITYCAFLAQLLMIGACLNDVLDARPRRRPLVTSTATPATARPGTTVDEGATTVATTVAANPDAVRTP
ncbi:MAG TPA: YihY/virulence factor BrkB family protein [Candidatus Dormibacteraeota bacterium]